MTRPIARGSMYRRLSFDADLIELCFRWYITYRLSYRDLVAMRPAMRKWKIRRSDNLTEAPARTLARDQQVLPHRPGQFRRSRRRFRRADAAARSAAGRFARQSCVKVARPEMASGIH